MCLNLKSIHFFKFRNNVVERPDIDEDSDEDSDEDDDETTGLENRLYS